MKQPQPTITNTGHGTLRSYTTGFVLSISLTLAAYFLVANHAYSRTTVLVLIVALAIVQFVVQLLFFLHLGREPKPRWKQVVFWFMLLVLFILVFGTLWIMNNLNYHMPSPTQTDHAIMEDEGIHH